MAKIGLNIRGVKTSRRGEIMGTKNGMRNDFYVLGREWELQHGIASMSFAPFISIRWIFVFNWSC